MTLTSSPPSRRALRQQSIAVLPPPSTSTRLPTFVTWPKYTDASLSMPTWIFAFASRSEEHTSELQSHSDLHSFPTRRSSDLVAAAQHQHAPADLRDVAEIHRRQPFDADVDLCLRLLAARNVQVASARRAA